MWRLVKRVQEWSSRKVRGQWVIIFKCKLTGNLNYERGLKICDPRWWYTKFVNLTLLTETCVNVEQYRGHGEVVVGLIADVCKCQRDTKGTCGNGYGQPQAVTERCDVAIPCHFRVVE
jgi:hypothetical protein